MFTYGFYQIGVGNRERREAKEEKILARAVIVPYLQAEEDRRFVRAWTAKKENDKAIMAEDVSYTHLTPPTKQEV